MARLIDADTVVTIQVYDDMTEETDTKKMTVAEAIDEWSDEGCPPTVDAEPIEHGRWIPVTKGALKEIYICSRCHRQIEDDGIPVLISQRYPYCHCGAKMDGERKDD